MTDDQRQRIEAAVREAATEVAAGCSPYPPLKVQSELVDLIAADISTSLTPVIDAMLSEASNNAHLEKVYTVFEEGYEKQLAARAALRWWRWANRDGAQVVICRDIGRLPMLPYDFDDE